METADLHLQSMRKYVYQQGGMFGLEPLYLLASQAEAEAIQIGIKGKKALLLTPAIYEIRTPIVISDPNFVVLGIGMPTLVSTTGLSAIVVEPEATGVRVAQILIEGSAPMTPDATEPLLFWRGDRGMASTRANGVLVENLRNSCRKHVLSCRELIRKCSTSFRMATRSE